MTKIKDLIYTIEGEEMSDNISGVPRMDENEKEKITDSALRKISELKPRTGRKRKIIILIACLTLVLSLAVAFAVNQFDFGKITVTDLVMSYEVETAALEDSDQYIAMKEYNDYLGSLTEEEYLEAEYNSSKEWPDIDEETQNREEPIIYLCSDKVKEIAEKYDLKVETMNYKVNSVKKALDGADMRNIVGVFGDIVEDENMFWYTDGGSLYISGTVPGYEENTYFHLDCIPKDVFRSSMVWEWNMGGDIEKEKEWYYVSEKDIASKCKSFMELKGEYINEDYEGKVFSYKDKMDMGYASGVIIDNDIETYHTVLYIDNYTVTLTVNNNLIDENSKSFTKKDFEAIIDTLG